MRRVYGGELSCYWQRRRVQFPSGYNQTTDTGNLARPKVSCIPCISFVKLIFRELSAPFAAPFAPAEHVQQTVQNIMGPGYSVTQPSTTTANGAPYVLLSNDTCSCFSNGPRYIHHYSRVAQPTQSVNPQFLAGPSTFPLSGPDNHSGNDEGYNS